MASIDAVVKWCEHVRTELGKQSTITVKPVEHFEADTAPATTVADGSTGDTAGVNAKADDETPSA